MHRTRRIAPDTAIMQAKAGLAQGKTVLVHGHYRKNGVYVRSHLAEAGRGINAARAWC